MSALDLLQQGLYGLAQQIAQACLKLDPSTAYRLQALNGKVAGLNINDIGLRLYISPMTSGSLASGNQIQTIELSADSRVAADVFVSGSVKTCFLLLQSPEITSLDELPAGVQVEGDLVLLQELLSIIKNLDLDWESAIAPFTGDVAAHQMGKNLRASEKWLATSLREAKRLAEEYVTEELPVARESEQFKPFFDKVAQAKMVADDLRKKINLKGL